MANSVARGQAQHDPGFDKLAVGEQSKARLQRVDDLLTRPGEGLRSVLGFLTGHDELSVSEWRLTAHRGRNLRREWRVRCFVHRLG